MPDDFWNEFWAEFLSNIASVAFLTVLGYGFRGRIVGFIKKILDPQSLDLSFPEGDTRSVIRGDNEDYDVNLNLNLHYIGRSPLTGRKDLHIYFPAIAKYLKGNLQKIDSTETHNHYRVTLKDDILPGRSEFPHPRNLFRFEKYKGEQKKFEIYYYFHSSSGYFPESLNESIGSREPIDPSKGGLLEIDLLD